MHHEDERTSSSSWTSEEDEVMEYDLAGTPPTLDLFSEFRTGSAPPAESSSPGDGDDDEEESEEFVPGKATQKASLYKPNRSSPSALNMKTNGDMSIASSSKASKCSADENGAQNSGKRKREARVEGKNRKKRNRLWEEEDAKNLLALFLEYLQTEIGAPNDTDAFFNFSERKLGKFQKKQVVDKLRRLRNKYEMNAMMEKKGDLNIFSTDHDQEIFRICKGIWGAKARIEDVMFNENVKEAGKEPNGEMRECNLKEDEMKGKEETKALIKKRCSKQEEKEKIELDKYQSCTEERRPLKNEMKIPELKTSEPVASVPKDGNYVAILNEPEDSMRGTVSWSSLVESFGTLCGLHEAVEKGIELWTKSKVNELEENRKKLEEMRLEIEFEFMEISSERAGLALEVMKVATGKVEMQDT